MDDNIGSKPHVRGNYSLGAENLGDFTVSIPTCGELFASVVPAKEVVILIPTCGETIIEA